MTSKKPEASKRTRLPRAADYTNAFLKLIYALDDSKKAGQVVFVRAGSHAELFRE